MQTETIALELLFLLVPPYSLWLAVRVLGLDKTIPDTFFSAMFFTWLIHYCLFAISSGHGNPSGASVIPYYLAGYFVFALIATIPCFGFRRKETYLFAFIAAVGSTIPTSVLAIGNELAAQCW